MRRTILLVGGIVAAVVAVRAQQAPIFRASTEVVQLDISVLDKDRVPVRGLTAADFTILEDGKPQKIVAFSAMEVPDPPAPLPVGVSTWTREVTSDVQTNRLPPEGRLFVMLLDDLLIPFELGAIESAKKAARGVVHHLSPSDQMAVVFTGETAGAQNFTSDRAKLLAAIDEFRPGHATYAVGWDTGVSGSGSSGKPGGSTQSSGPTMDSDMGLRMASMRTLRNVGEALISAPQRRKILVFISPGVPVNFGANHPVLASGTGKGMPIREANIQLADEMSPLFREMQRANITVYPIDPTGLEGLSPFITRILSGTVLARAAPAQPKEVPVSRGPSPPPASQDGLGPGAVPVDPTTGEAPAGHPPTIDSLAHFQVKLDLDFLEATAANTGGRAIVHTNDFEPGIAAMFRENGSYYLIAYEATDPGSGKLHRTAVKVGRPDVDVRTRSGYDASDASADKKTASATPDTLALAGVLPKTAMPMQASLAPFGSPGKAGATVAIVLSVSEPAPHEKAVETIDLETRAFTPDGVARGVQQQTAHLSLMAGGESDTVRYELLSQIDLAPGRYQLRLAAHSALGDKTGSVFADVDVPDFANAPLALSGVLLEASPHRAVAPKDGLGALVPTSERTFDRRDLVSAFLRVYQAGRTPPAAVTLRIRVLDTTGAVMVDREDTLGAASFTGVLRAADEHISLPLDHLEPGEYLLSIEASLGHATARRDVRVTVK